MAKISPNSIRSLSEDWSNDPRNNMPYSGKAVQDFLRAQLSKVDGKFGSVEYEGGNLVFYNEDGGKELARVTLTGTSYIVSVVTNKATSFNALTTDETCNITLKPSTQSVDFGSTEKVDFPEDYTFTLEVDNGSGYIDRTPKLNTIKSGETGTVDIRPYLTTGANRIRIVVKGMSSEQPRTMSYTCSLTSLNLTVQHNWWQAWRGGEAYSINNIFFSANIQKVLHVKVGTSEYTQTFSASQNYNNVPCSFDLTEKAPTTTGVKAVEIWLVGEGVETEHYKFNIMFVAANDTTSGLVCINDVKAKPVNYTSYTSDDPLFAYATYNVTSVQIILQAKIDGTNNQTLLNTTTTVQTQTKQVVATNLQVDTESQNVILNGIVSGTEQPKPAQQFNVTLDNSNAFIATAGATLFINPSIRSNGTSDRTEIINSATGAATASYAGTWTGFTFADDAWATDDDGNKALAVKAGSSLVVPTLKPHSAATTKSVTIEFMYRASNIADYDKPIISLMSTENYSAASTIGVCLFPTKLVVLTSNEKQEVFQKLDLPENRIIHVAIAMTKNYANKANLMRIYINGRENCTFSMQGTSTIFDSNSAYNYLRIGQQSTDTYLYMMRAYESALGEVDVFNNYLNALINTAETSKIGEKKDNAITDGGEIDYSLAKKAGFNCFVVETDSNIPDLDHQTALSGVNLHFEYNDNPENNVSIYGVPMDGQGTTSSKYFRWNLRSKIKSTDTVWKYPNYENGKQETGKDGYLFGYGKGNKIGTITAKKNVASSPQGHKMGATQFYHELFAACEGLDMLPNANCRVAVYQQPFLGFQKFSDGSYSFIGLYTIGADKKDKKTFGYNETTAYPSLMMIEGPNHAPYMTRFLVPWTDDVFYDYANETLSTGDSTNKQEGWDADIAADYSTDKAADQQSIYNMFVSEFKPAYDAIYYNSPYLAALTESGKTLAEINANITSFQSAKTNGIKNELMTFYDSEYRLVYFRVKTGQYEVLPKTTHDMLTYLGLTGSPTTAQLLAARATKWLATVPTYVSLSESCFHECFCELLGVSDNHAKNTYWRKFKSILLGGKWGFNQDDLDTIFETDNNGQDTKDYFIEVGDINAGGTDIFQGATSAFWYQLRQLCQAQLKDKMKDIVDKAVTLATKYKVGGATVRESVFNLIGYYFWTHSAKYFPATAYNEDTKFAYINVYLKDTTKTYNDVAPLTQIHGDHYETERAWVERRIDYIFSKYQIGAFEAGASDGLGSLEFTSAEAFNMKIKPAMDLYPRLSVGGGATSSSARTKAGQEYTLALGASGDTTLYIKALDLISELGDLSGLKLSSRGGVTVIAFDVQGKRLRKLVIGNADADAVKFNANTLSVASAAMEEVDAKNVTTLQGTLDLRKCPRLKKADLTNTNLTVVYPPIGGRVNELKMPATLNTLFLHSLNLLEQEGITIPDAAWSKINMLYFNQCASINPVDFLASILAKTGNILQFVTMVWSGNANYSDSSLISSLLTFCNKTGVGALQYNSTTGDLTTYGSVPHLEGTIYFTGTANRKNANLLTQKIPTLTILAQKFINMVEFADAEVKNVILANATHETADDITEEEMSSISSIGTWFKNNTSIKEFNELSYTGVSELKSYCFYGCANLEKIDLSKITKIGYQSLYGATKPIDAKFGDNQIITIADKQCFANSGIKEIGCKLASSNALQSIFADCVYLKRVKGFVYPFYLNLESFKNCSSLESFSFENISNTKIESSCFYGCESLSSVADVDNITEIGEKVFMNCKSLKRVSFKNVTIVRNNAFAYCPIEELYLPNLAYLYGESNFAGLKQKVVCMRNLIKTESYSQCFIKAELVATFFPQMTYVGAYFHRECANLKLTDFGKNVTEYDQMILNCTANQVNFISRAVSPPTLGGFRTVPRYIFVPGSSVDTYKSATNWSNGQWVNRIVAIGGTEWQTVMQSLAAEEGYTLKAGESWADEYIDYKIYGLEPPED